MPNRLAALPSGALGRIGGQIMRRGNARQQQEIAAFVDTLLAESGDARVEVLELGCGPGVLLGLLARRPGIGRVVAVDPSPTMRTMAVHAVAREVADDRVRIRPGQAERTGLPDAAVDLVVSVNSVAIWPDLDAGLDELARVLRPGGRLVLSWHGGSAPTRSGAALRLPVEQLDRLEAALTRRFDDIRRELTARCTVFTASR